MKREVGVKVGEGGGGTRGRYTFQKEVRTVRGLRGVRITGTGDSETSPVGQ